LPAAQESNDEVLAPSDANLLCIRGTDFVCIRTRQADGVILTVEALGRDFPTVLDHRSLKAAVRAIREAADVVQGAAASLSDGKLRVPGERFGVLVAQLRRSGAALPAAIEELEAKVKDTRAFTQQVEEARGRLLGPLPTALEVLAGLSQALLARRDHSAALQRHEAARARADAACAKSVVQHGRRLQRECGALAERMDGMLAPFIRISQNIKGKDKIGGSTLTEDEMACIRKHTTVLLKPDLYDQLADGGGDFLEDFLEALFLLGIAGGVGADQTAARSSGLSRRSQALLADALQSFDADQLRASHTEWRALRVAALAAEEDPAFRAGEAEAEAAVVHWEEAARELDRASREWHKHAPAYREAVAALAQHRAAVERSWLREFGAPLCLVCLSEEPPSPGAA
jgi:hypothetical protein